MHLIETAALGGETLWLLCSTGTFHPSGTLFALDVPNRKRAEISIPSSGTIEQFCMLPGGKIIIASSNRELWQYSSGKMEFLATLPESPLPALLDKYGLDNQSTIREVWESGMVRGRGCLLFRDRILKMFANGQDVLILTSSSLLRYGCVSGRWDVVSLPNLIPKTFRMPAIMPGDGYLYQGTCLGEDGGDLKRIDIKTGAIDILYEGTQVTSVMLDPWNAGSVLFSTGTWHMGLNRGGIYPTRGREPFFSGKAIYSISSYQNDIIAASPDGVYRFANGICFRFDYPDYSLFDGIRVVSDERFGTFVLTDIYRHRMVCGSVPLFLE
ncbi:MAG: hypothetical protein M0Q91_10175 [Methanoregula sp.]|jgi:hypothetical protein|nr:hypothetical protein [Methanoregula sp.]